MFKIITALFLTFSPIVLFSQVLTPEVLIKKAELMEWDFNTDSILVIYNQILEKTDNGQKLSTRNRLRFHLIQANIWERNSRFSKLNKLLKDIEPLAKTLTPCDTHYLAYYNLVVTTLSSIGKTKLSREIQTRLLAQDCLNPESLFYADLCDNEGLFQGRSGNFDEAEAWFRKGLDVRQKFESVHPLQLSKSYRYLGSTYTEKGSYSKAIDYFNIANDIATRHKGSEILFSSIYFGYAIAYGFAGDLHTAINYLSQAEKQFLSLSDTTPELQIYICNTYGNAWRALDSFNLAYQYYDKALNLIQKHPDTRSSQPVISISLASWYQDIGQYSISQSICRETRSLLLTEFSEEPEFPYFLSKAYGTEALCYYYQEKHDSAIVVFDSLFKAVKPYFKDKPFYLYEPMNNYASCLSKKGKNEESIEILNQVIQILNATEDQSFPEWLDAINASYAVWNKADCYEQMAKANNSKDYLKQALKGYSRYLDFVDFLRSSYRKEGSKIDLTSDNLIAYQKAIEVSLKFHAPAVDFDECFNFMERNKSLVLLEAFNRNSGPELLPDSFQISLALRSQAVETAEQTFYYTTANPKATQLEKDKQQQLLLESQTAFYAHLDTIKKIFPKYFAARYETQVISFDSLSKSLQKDGKSMIATFLYDTVLILIGTNGKESKLVQYKADSSLLSKIKLMKTGITGFYTNTEEYSESYAQLSQDYVQAAYDLYKLLVEPFESILKREVLIIPDGLLSYLPFEALLTSPVKNPLNFASHPYWILNKDIQYAYSATLWIKMKSLPKQRKASKSVWAIAPTFDLKSGFPPLFHNAAEVLYIRQLWGGDIDTAATATEMRFKLFSKNYDILHLSTHGFANDIIGENCFLAFTPIDDPTNDDTLFVREIYPLNLKADLIFISACEAGIGEIKRGEGMISLARAFAYAGVSSIITSLWKAEGEPTRELTNHFYEILHADNSKLFALSEAKRQLIKSGNAAFAHPFFWANFIGIGGM